MKQLTNAKIAVHQIDADYVARKKSPPKPKNIMIKALTSVIKPAPVEPDLLLKDGDKIGPLLVIETPGHTMGSISLLDKERKVMFVGDTIRFVDGKLQFSAPQFTLDADKAKQSVGKISTFDFDVMLSGHGQPLMPDASQKIKEFYATLK